MYDQESVAKRRIRRPRYGPGRPAACESLTPEEVAEAAFQLINAEGEAALTIDALASLVFARMPIPSAKGHWKTRIRRICFGNRDIALADAGLTPTAQAVAYQTVRLYVRAHCLWEIEELGAHRAVDSTGLAHSATDYSRAAAALSLIFKPDPDRQFEAGLDLILQALQTANAR